MAHAYSANTGKAKGLESTLGYIVRYRPDWAMEEDFVPDGKKTNRRVEARRRKEK